jgi:hypothetical protein
LAARLFQGSFAKTIFVFDLNQIQNRRVQIILGDLLVSASYKMLS